MRAPRLAPGLGRAMGFQRWPAYRGGPQSIWDRMKEAARAEALPRAPAPVVARDLHPKALDAARRNLEAAGLAADVRLEAGDARAIRPFAEAGTLCANPPYGERLMGREGAMDEPRDPARGARGGARGPTGRRGAEAGRAASPRTGRGAADSDPHDPRQEALRRKKLQGLYRGLAEAAAEFHGWNVILLSGSPQLAVAFGRPVVSHKLWNGPLEVRLLTYRIG